MVMKTSLEELVLQIDDRKRKWTGSFKDLVFGEIEVLRGEEEV